MSPSLTPLQLDPGCTNRANWCCRIEFARDHATNVEAGMVKLGYGSHSRHPMLKVFRQGGREVAWVVASGRVQVRVPMAVQAERRERAAHRSWLDLAASLGIPGLEDEQGGPP